MTFDHTTALRVRYSGLDHLLLPHPMKSEDARSAPAGARAKRKGTSTTIQAADHILSRHGERTPPKESPPTYSVCSASWAWVRHAYLEVLNVEVLNVEVLNVEVLNVEVLNTPEIT